MTIDQIKSASMEEVRAFMASFVPTVDVTNPEHVDLLHAAKSRACSIQCRETLRALQSGETI